MFGISPESKATHYGTPGDLRVREGDVVLISGAPHKHLQNSITQGKWGEPNTTGAVWVGQVTHTPYSEINPQIPSEQARMVYTVEAVVGNDAYDLKSRRPKMEDSVDKGFVGVALLRRAQKPPKDGTLTTYHARTLDGRMPLLITERREVGQSFFTVDIDIAPQKPWFRRKNTKAISAPTQSPIELVKAA